MKLQKTLRKKILGKNKSKHGMGKKYVNKRKLTKKNYRKYRRTIKRGGNKIEEYRDNILARLGEHEFLEEQRKNIEAEEEIQKEENEKDKLKLMVKINFDNFNKYATEVKAIEAIEGSVTDDKEILKKNRENLTDYLTNVVHVATEGNYSTESKITEYYGEITSIQKTFKPLIDNFIKILNNPGDYGIPSDIGKRTGLDKIDIEDFYNDEEYDGYVMKKQ